MNAPKIDDATKKAVYAFMRKIIEEYKPIGFILFGSRARHTHHPESDADVAVLLSGFPGKFITTKLAMADIAYDVLLDTGIRIQPLPIWEQEWNHPEKYRNPRLLENISREGIKL